MRSWIKLGGIGLLALSVSVVTPAVWAAKTVSAEEQVAVLLKWYRTYFDEGKYKQAEQIAELAKELAPEDPQIEVALKLARRQQSNSAISPEVGAQLEKVLQKLDRVERQLREIEAQKRQKARIQIAKELPGSPDARE